MTEQIFLLRKQLESQLSASRYEHSISVSYLSVALAMRYGYSIEKAEMAGLLHDCAKRYSEERLIQKCEKHQVELTPQEHCTPAVIHAKYGAWMVQHKLGIHDPEILSAIRYHTTGRPHMELWEKILFVADYIEPRRMAAPHLESVRHQAFVDLDQAVLTIASDTLAYLKSRQMTEDPMTRETFVYYQSILQTGEQEGEHTWTQKKW